MIVRRYAALFAMATMTITSNVGADPTAKAECWHADEVTAARVGTLQTLLMVQALKCQYTLPATLVAYNKFMADKHDVILHDRYLIQAHFVRQYGASDGLKASDDYQTQLGNRNSSAVVTVAECEKAGTYSRFAAVAGENDLAALANMAAAAAPIPQCPEPVAVAAPPAAMVIPVWRKPAPAVTPPTPAPVKAEPVIAVVAPREHSPEILAAISSTVHDPVPVAVKPIPPSPPAPNADQIKALQAAVAVLAQVAATLQPTAATAAAPSAVARAEE